QRWRGSTTSHSGANCPKELSRFKTTCYYPFTQESFQCRCLPLCQTLECVVCLCQGYFCTWSIHAFLDQEGRVVANFLLIKERNNMCGLPQRFQTLMFELQDTRSICHL